MPNDDHRAEEIKLLCRDHAEAMIGVLSEVALDPLAKSAARVVAARTLLERGFGAPERKVEQRVDHHVHDHRQAHLEALQGLAQGQRALPPARQHVEDAEFEEIKAQPTKD